MNQPEYTFTDFDRKLGALLAQRVGHNRKNSQDEQPIDEVSIEIGRIIRQARLAKHLTLRNVAEIATIPTAHVAALENGIVISTFIILEEIDAVAVALSLGPNLFRELLGQPKKSAESRHLIAKTIEKVSNQIRNQWRWGQAYFGSLFNLVQHIGYSTMAVILFIVVGVMNLLPRLSMTAVGYSLTDPMWLNDRITPLIVLATSATLFLYECSNLLFQWCEGNAERWWRLQRRFLTLNSVGFVVTFAIYGLILTEISLPTWLDSVRNQWFHLEEHRIAVESTSHIEFVLQLLLALQLVGLGAMYWLQAKIISREGRILFAFARSKKLTDRSP